MFVQEFEATLSLWANAFEKSLEAIDEQKEVLQFVFFGDDSSRFAHAAFSAEQSFRLSSGAAFEAKHEEMIEVLMQTQFQQKVMGEMSPKEGELVKQIQSYFPNLFRFAEGMVDWSDVSLTRVAFDEKLNSEHLQFALPIEMKVLAQRYPAVATLFSRLVDCKVIILNADKSLAAGQVALQQTKHVLWFEVDFWRLKDHFLWCTATEFQPVEPLSPIPFDWEEIGDLSFEVTLHVSLLGFSWQLPQLHLSSHTANQQMIISIDEISATWPTKLVTFCLSIKSVFADLQKSFKATVSLREQTADSFRLHSSMQLQYPHSSLLAHVFKSRFPGYFDRWRNLCELLRDICASLRQDAALLVL